ncbi:Zinc carboxypeptidase precursor [compost metagenome]
MTKPWHGLLPTLGIAIMLAGCGTGQQPADTPAPIAGAPAALRVEAAPADPTRRQVVIRFSNRDQLAELATSGIDLFENVDHAQRTVGATVTARTEPVLKRLGVSYTDDARVSAMGLPAGYQTVEQIYADMKALAAAHPTFISYVEFGQSLETRQGKANRPIAALRVTAKRDAGLPAIRLGAGVHARELPPVAIMTRFAHTLADGYGEDPAITKLVDTKDIWIVPLQNPDGRARVDKGEAMWRKNTRHDTTSPDGVDCNRNADDHFQQGTSDPRAEDFRGTAPFSEPESQAIRDLAKKQPFDVSLDMHAYGGMVLWPPGYDTSHTRDEAAFRRIGEALGKRLGYRSGTIAHTVYPTFGDTATWEYTTHGTLAFAAELDCGSFSPAHSEVDRQWTKWKPALLDLVAQSGSSRKPTERKPEPTPSPAPSSTTR